MKKIFIKNGTIGKSQMIFLEFTPDSYRETLS